MGQWPTSVTLLAAGKVMLRAGMELLQPRRGAACAWELMVGRSSQLPLVALQQGVSVFPWEGGDQRPSNAPASWVPPSRCDKKEVFISFSDELKKKKTKPKQCLLVHLINSECSHLSLGISRLSKGGKQS